MSKIINTKPIGFFLINAVIAVVLLMGCTTTKEDGGLGVQEAHVGFVPARISILPCTTWPEGSRFKTKPLSNAKADTFSLLCTSFDKFVLEGFGGQPFMKGFSPNFVQRSLATAGKPDHLSALAPLLGRAASDCMECDNIASFYRRSLASRTQLQVWLSETSRMIKNSDAMLLPTILYAWERRYNDRGVLVLERSASAALLLISTANGDLIWAQSRAAVVPVRVLESSLNNQTPTPPEWSTVSGQIFTEHIWADFPGRQVY